MATEMTPAAESAPSTSTPAADTAAPKSFSLWEPDASDGSDAADSGTQAGDEGQSPVQPAAAKANPEKPAEAAPTQAPSEGKDADPQPPEPPEAPTPRFKQLMDREAKARELEKTVKEREAKLAEREAKLNAEDPNERLAAIGLTYEQLTDLVISGKKLTPAQKAAEPPEVKALREQVEALQADAASQKAERIAAATEAFRGRINTFVTENSDKFDYINSLGETDRVFAVIDAHFAETGELLGGSQEAAIEAAAAKVEAYLEERYAKRVLTSKKFQQTLSSAPSKREVGARPSANPGQPAKSSQKSLTNSQAAAVPPRAPTSFSDRDEAIAALVKGGLRLHDDE